MRRMLLHLAAASCLAAVASAQEPSIGVYVDAAGTVCTGATIGGVLQGSVWVNLDGAAAAGITGAEFRLDNSDRADYQILFTPDPAAAAVLGNPTGDGPFNTGGVNIAYADCQTSSRVQLFTFTVLESAPSTDVWFEVRQHWNPSNYLYSCPLLTLCDAPTYTAVCVGLPDSVHWRAVINPSNGVSSDCAPVGVTASTWTTIKNLYRG